jgi:hypothetical protein
MHFCLTGQYTPHALAFSVCPRTARASSLMYPNRIRRLRFLVLLASQELATESSTLKKLRWLALSASVVVSAAKLCHVSLPQAAAWRAQVNRTACCGSRVRHVVPA